MLEKCQYCFFLPLVLDECTSALSEESEEMLYSKLMDLGITFMSIGQRSSLKKVCSDFVDSALKALVLYFL